MSITADSLILSSELNYYDRKSSVIAAPGKNTSPTNSREPSLTGVRKSVVVNSKSPSFQEVEEVNCDQSRHSASATAATGDNAEDPAVIDVAQEGTGMVQDLDAILEAPTKVPLKKELVTGTEETVHHSQHNDFEYYVVRVDVSGSEQKKKKPEFRQSLVDKLMRRSSRRSSPSSGEQEGRRCITPIESRRTSAVAVPSTLTAAVVEERKTVINHADMPEEMQKYAVDCASQAMDKYSFEMDIAGFIKKDFDKKYGANWHCIVGRNFGSYVTPELKNTIHFHLGQLAILLFKSG